MNYPAVLLLIKEIEEYYDYKPAQDLINADLNALPELRSLLANEKKLEAELRLAANKVLDSDEKFFDITEYNPDEAYREGRKSGEKELALDLLERFFK